MDFGTGHSVKHLQWPGEIELSEVWEEDESYLHGGSYFEAPLQTFRYPLRYLNALGVYREFTDSTLVQISAQLGKSRILAA